jgi:capsular polysaccharide biosynthesis protein
MTDLQEIPIKALRKRHVGLFDPLERDGDFKVILPASIGTMPAACAFMPDKDRSVGRQIQPAEAYEFPEVSLDLIANAVVARSGATITSKMEVIEETIEGAQVDSISLDIDLGGPIISLPEVVSASKFGNFNHAIFTSETLPLLYLAKVDQNTALVPKVFTFDTRYCSSAYIADHLNFLRQTGLAIADRLVSDQAVRADRAFVPVVSRRVGAYRGSQLSRFLATHIVACANTDPVLSRPLKVYVSRRYAASRIPINIDELEKIADHLGYTPIYPERLDLLSQVRLFANCSAIVAEHGAGLINMLYCRPSTRILELFPQAMFKKWTFRLTAYCASLRYALGMFSTPPGWVYNADGVFIDPDYFKQAVSEFDNWST